MCTVVHSIYKIDYEVLGSRKSNQGETKKIQLDCVNYTGGLKFLIKISCLAPNHNVEVGRNNSQWSDRFEELVLLPQSYWRNGKKIPSNCNSIFFASIKDSAPKGLKTILDGFIKVEAKPNFHDLDAIKKSKEFPKEHEFFPPLEVI